jgi:hypothetical protein
MIAKIYIEIGEKTKRLGGRRGQTLARIVIHDNKNFRWAHLKRKRNSNNRAISGVTTVLL